MSQFITAPLLPSSQQHSMASVLQIRKGGLGVPANQTATPEECPVPFSPSSLYPGLGCAPEGWWDMQSGRLVVLVLPCKRLSLACEEHLPAFYTIWLMRG